MVDFEILEESGTTNARLREFFTTREADKEGASPDEKKRITADLKRLKKVEDNIGSRISENIRFSHRTHHPSRAVELA